MSRRIRVMIADEHEDLDGGVGKLIRVQDDMEVVAEVREGCDILPVALELVPDVMLLDLTMTGGGLSAPA